MKHSSPFMATLFLLILLTNTFIEAPSWSDYIPNGNVILQTFISNLIPLTIGTATKGLLCCLRRRGIRRQIRNFDPNALMTEIKSIIKKRIIRCRGDKNIVRDINDIAPRHLANFSDLFIIGFGEESADFFHTQSTAPQHGIIQQLQATHGVILICANFSPLHGRYDLNSFSINNEKLRVISNFFIENKIPFLIIHLEEQATRSINACLLHIPAFTVRTVSIPHIAHSHFHAIPKITGRSALSVSGVIKEIQNHIATEAEFFESKKDVPYPKRRPALTYVNAFLKHLHDDLPEDDDPIDVTVSTI